MRFEEVCFRLLPFFSFFFFFLFFSSPLDRLWETFCQTRLFAASARLTPSPSRRSESQTIIDCALAKLSEAVGVTVENVDRIDNECDADFLGSTLEHNVTLSEDPCCNATLRTDTCCDRRAYSYSTTSVVVNPILASDSSSIGLVCDNPRLARYLLSQFERLYSRSINGLCAAQVEGVVNTVDERLGVARLCYERVYRADLLCSTTDDCLSGLCVQGRCVPHPETAAEQLLRCLVVNLAEEIRPLLKLQLGLTVSSLDADLEAAFRDAVTTGVCEDRPNPLDPFVDARYSPSVVGAFTAESCLNDADDFICEDGGSISECGDREVCVYKEFRVIINSTRCLGLCTNPRVTEEECERVEGCNIRTANATECVRSGVCSDRLIVFGGGVCLEPFPVVGRDEDVCLPNYIQYPAGCVSFARVSKSECTGRWLTPATSAQTCLSERRCAGEDLEPVWDWTPGLWAKGRLMPVLKRESARVLRQRRWLARIDWDKLSSLLESVFSQRVAAETGSLLRCQTVPALTILRYALCDCSTLSNRPRDKCWDYSAPLVLGVRSVAKGTSGRAQTSVGFINWFVSSCADDKVPCSFEFGILLRPTPSLDMIRSTTLYEPVYDPSKSKVIGSALSDLSYVQFSEKLRGSIEICIFPDLSSQDNCTSCYPAFAFSPNGLSLLTFLDDVPITVREGHYCGTVSETGYYVASSKSIPSQASIVGLGWGWSLFIVFLIASLLI